MKQIIVLPTWILVRLITPFLNKDHLFKNIDMSLKKWAKNSTDLNDAFSILFWGTIIIFFILLPQLL